MPAPRDVPRILTPTICAALGITRAHLRTAVRRGYWRPLAPGVVLTRPDPAGRLDWADVGLAVGGPTTALSGWDALRLIGLGGPRPPRPTVLVLTRDGRSRRVGDVLVRRTDRPYSARRTAGAVTVAPARAVADTALWTPLLSDVRALVADAVRRGSTRPVDIERELEAGPQQGSGFLRTALAEVTDGARSAAEAEAAAQLSRANVPAFELNVPVVDDGRHPALRPGRPHPDPLPPSACTRPGRPWLREVESWLRSRAIELGMPYRSGGGVRTGGAPLVVRRHT